MIHLRNLLAAGLGIPLIMLFPTAVAASPACLIDSPQGSLVLFQDDVRRFKVECVDEDGDLVSIGWTWAMGGGATEAVADASWAWSEQFLTFRALGRQAVTAEGVDAAGQRSGVQWEVEVKERAPEGTRGRAPSCAVVQPSSPDPVPLTQDKDYPFEVHCQDPDGDLFRVEWFHDGAQMPSIVSDVVPLSIHNDLQAVSFPRLDAHILAVVGIDAQGHRSAPVLWNVQVLQGEAPPQTTTPPPASPTSPTPPDKEYWAGVFTVVALGITTLGAAAYGVYRKFRPEGGPASSRAPPKALPPPEPSGSPAPPVVPPGVVPRYQALYVDLREAQKYLDATSHALAEKMLKDLEAGGWPPDEERREVADHIEVTLSKEPSRLLKRGEPAVKVALARLRE